MPARVAILRIFAILEFDMEHLGKILAAKHRTSPVLKNISTALVIAFSNEVVEEIFGEEIARQIRILHFTGGTIVAACLSSSCASKFHGREKEIIEKVNQKIGEQTVKNIRYLA